MFELAPALTSAAIGGVSGLFVPSLIARIPEPEPEEEPATESQDPAEPSDLEPDLGDEPPKELYADIARLPGLRWGAALASALAAFVIGAALGWAWGLCFVLVLCPVGVALAVIDWRTHLLPTKVIAPLYGVVIALVLVAVIGARAPGALLGAFVGWVIYGLFFFTLWFFSRGQMGYGDVRLSGVLGIVLGALGLETFFVGMLGGALLGALASVVTWLAKGRKAQFAYGPYMLLGVLVGVVLGPAYADYLAGR